MTEPVSILQYLVSIFGVVMSLAHFPQAYKIYRRRQAGDISLVTYAIFFTGSLLWLLYGLERQDVPVILTFGLGVVGTGTVIGLALRFRGATSLPET